MVYRPTADSPTKESPATGKVDPVLGGHAATSAGRDRASVVSRAVAPAMLFVGGFALGRYAGYGSWKVGLLMIGLGTALVTAIMALGG